MAKTFLVNPTPSPSSNFQVNLPCCLESLEKRTTRDLLAHPLASQLQTCDSPGSILSAIKAKRTTWIEFDKVTKDWTKRLSTTVNVLLAFSAILGEGISLVFSPATVIFAGAGVLLRVSILLDVSLQPGLTPKLLRQSRMLVRPKRTLSTSLSASRTFFKRLESYIEVRPSAAMTDIIVKIMVEVPNILAITIKEIKQGRTMGKVVIEAALRILNKLSQEEVRMATAQLLKITHGVDEKVKDVSDTVKLVLDDGKTTRAVMQQTASEATTIMQLLTNHVGEVKMNQWRQDLRKWLSSPDPSSNHIILCNAQHQGTAKWFFRGRLLEAWKSTGTLLWIHGKPGSGKSILWSTKLSTSSAVVQDIMTLRDAGLASMAYFYFYFDFRDTDKQNRRSLLLSLLSQLSARSNLCCDILHRAFVTHDNGAHKPTDDVLIQCLKKTLTFSNGHPIYIIMDALDECPNTFGMPTPRELVLNLVKARPEIDIRNALEPLTSLRVSLHDQTGQKKDTIEYVRSVVHSDTMMGKWGTQDQKLVIKTLSNRANGMFRWVFCQLETLRHCFPPSLRRTLQELPKYLDETYERVLKNISQASRAYVHRLLQCLMVTVRPLRLEELAFDFESSSGGGIPKLNEDWRREDQEHARDGGSRVVQFSHFSVKEFLISDRLATAIGAISFHHIALAPAHTILAQASLGILLRLDDSTREITPRRFPLAEYAAEHWVHHALFKDVSIRLKGASLARWIWIHDMDDITWGLADGEVLPKRLAAAPVYYAALCGLPDVVEKLLIKYPEHASARGGASDTASHAAATRNHLNVAARLYTSLPYVEIAQWLLEHGADVNAKQDDHWTPLHEAANNGRVELVRALLENHDVDIDAQNEIGNTPLHAASSNGEVQVARLLLDRGAGIKACGKDRSTPLHVASCYGKMEVVRLLVERGADVSAEDDEGRTAYQIALQEGHNKIAQLLAGHGVEK
ncbi:hypothetical protein V8E53_011914 [Lactarius tabidus]